MEKLLYTQSLTKKYDSNEVLSSIDLSVYRAQSVAFVGHNGSGKSTLLKILANLVRPTSGKVVHLGKLKFNYVPESFSAPNFTANSYIQHIGEIEGLDKRSVLHKRDELFHRFFMEDMAATPMKHLSKGTLQKVCVVQALLAKPDILLLDEPLSGQDMDSQHEFIRQVKKLEERGVSILMACHEPHLIRHLAKSVYEIDNGRLLQKHISDSEYMEYCELVFVSSGQSLKSPAFTDEEVEVRYTGGKLILTVPIHKSNAVIVKTIQAGWTLREIHHENNA